MLYRKFGKLDINMSVLGFGCMRLPIVGNDQSKIDEAKAIEMLHYAIDNGVNYIDTAYPYHGGNSEPLVGKALQNGYRDKVYLATKNPVARVSEHAGFMKLLDEQLDKLQTDHIDFYLLHALNSKTWEQSKQNDVFRFIRQALDEGKIRHIGFSFHDQLSVFKSIIDEYDWDFCQIQYNFMNETYQAGTEGLHYAAAKGIAVVIMEPLLGGKLTKSVPPALQAIWNQAPKKKSPAEWALSWLWNKPEVTIVLSGMTTMDQVKENVEIASRCQPDCLSDEDLAIIEQAREFYQQRTKVNCTLCQYCMPCPNGVKIPSIFRLYNDAAVYDNHESSARWYKQMIADKVDASACIECGQCEEACPQNIEIRKHLKEFHRQYAGSDS